jgi:hypothetical protein
MPKKVEYQITPEQEEKILGKLYSIALTKIAIGDKAFIRVPDFKHILFTYKVSSHYWFDIAKVWEERNLIKLHGTRCLSVRLSYSSLAGLYKNNYHIMKKTVRMKPSSEIRNK